MRGQGGTFSTESVMVPQQVGREGLLAAGGRVGEDHNEFCLGRGAFEMSLRHLRDT